MRHLLLADRENRPTDFKMDLIFEEENAQLLKGVFVYLLLKKLNVQLCKETMNLEPISSIASPKLNKKVVDNNEGFTWRFIKLCHLNGSKKATSPQIPKTASFFSGAKNP